MLKYSRDIKKFKSTADLKTLENAIQLKGLDFINSRMTFPVSNAGSEPTFGNLSPESRELLLQKVVNSNYLNRELIRKIGLGKLELIRGDKLTLDRLNFTRFKGKKNMLVHALDARAPEFVLELSKKASINPFLLLETRIRNNLETSDFDFGGRKFSFDVSSIESLNVDEFDGYSLSKNEIFQMLQDQSGRKGELQRVEKYHHMLQNDPEFQLQSYTNLIQCHSRRDKSGGAEETYRIIKNGKLPTNSEMYQYLIDASTLSKAVNYFYEPKYKSAGMWTALTRSYFKYNEPLLAYRCVKNAIKDGRRNKQSSNFHIPVEMIQLLLSDLKGKSIDYFRDTVKLVNFGNALPLVVSKLILHSPEPNLGKTLFEEFTSGSCQGFDYPIAAKLGGIRQLGASDVAASRRIFDEALEKSQSRRADFYDEMLAVYSKHGKQAESNDLFKEMVREGIRPNLNTWESLLRAEIDVKNDLYEQMVVPSKTHPLIFAAMRKELVSPLYLE